jgi:uncharacterized protein YyaL (SSP411 family)
MNHRIMVGWALGALSIITASATAADDEVARRLLLQQALTKQLTLELPISSSYTQPISFVTRMIARQSDPKTTLDMAEKYWAAVINSPRHDTVRGGFFSADPSVQSQPHKSLLEQASIAEVLMDAIQIGGHDSSREAADVAKGLFTFVLRDLRLATGGFAETDALTTTLPENRPPIREVLNPFWNGLMVAAMARGSVVFGQQEYYTAATQTAEFLLTRCTTADDCLSVMHGALALYQAAGEARWLAAAIQFQDRLDREFWDAAAVNYRFSNTNQFLNELEMINLLRLTTITDDDSFRERANVLLAKAISTNGGDLLQNPGLLCAIDQQLGPSPHLTIVGDPTGNDTRALFSAAHRRYQPRLVLVTHAGDPVQKELRKRFPAMVPVPKVQGKATAYLCIGMMCNRPVTDPAALDKQVTEISYSW